MVFVSCYEIQLYVTGLQWKHANAFEFAVVTLSSEMSNRKENWRCLSKCGACCRLKPDERLEALKALDDDQLDKYLSMVGDDGWCVNYDKNLRICKIYDDRPDCCSVSNLSKLYKIMDGNSFAIKCCKEQIRSIYGGRSNEMKKFTRFIKV